MCSKSGLGFLLCAAAFAFFGKPADAQPAARKADDLVATLESPKCIAGQEIEEVLARLELRSGNNVADIGAGTRLFSRPLAKAVSPADTAYAVDIQQDLLDYIDKRGHQDNLSNIRPVLQGRFDDPRLPVDNIDLAFINDVLHHAKNGLPI